MLRIIPDRLKQYRLERRLTQHELAQKAGVGKQLVSKLESGASPGSIRTIRRLAVALLVMPDQISTVEELEQRDAPGTTLNGDTSDRGASAQSS